METEKLIQQSENELRLSQTQVTEQQAKQHKRDLHLIPHHDNDGVSNVNLACVA